MASSPAEFGIELEKIFGFEKIKTESAQPPVVESCELAILHQLVPEAGEALAGENLFRVG